MDCLELKLPVDSGYFYIAMNFIRGCAESFGFKDRPALNDIELAAEEAVTNVFAHALPTDEEPNFTIICRKIAAGIEILVRDRGIPFDPNRVAHFDPAILATGEDVRGLGLFLIRNAVDRLTYRNLGREGKEVQLIKFRDRQLPTGMPERPEENRSNGTALPRGRKRCELDVRMFKPEDAIEVARCAYLMHGYTFYDEDVYYPEVLEELHNTGKMTAALAVTPEGEVALFNALLRHEPDSPTAEMTYVLVNPGIRAPGAMEKVGRYLLENESRWLKGITSAVTTSHTLTQNVMARNGFIPIAIYLCADAAEWKFHFLNREDQARDMISDVAFFMFLAPPPPPDVYAPARHREMIGKIYERLGVQPNWMEPPAEVARYSGGARAKLETEILEGEKNARITVMEYGQDLTNHVESFVRECRRRDIRFIELKLPMGRPEICFYVGQLEKLGFFFCGIMPMGKFGDYLLLQMPSEWDINYDAIKISSEDGRLLFDYVRNCEKERHASA